VANIERIVGFGKTEPLFYQNRGSNWGKQRLCLGEIEPLFGRQIFAKYRTP